MKRRHGVASTATSSDLNFGFFIFGYRLRTWFGKTKGKMIGCDKMTPLVEINQWCHYNIQRIYFLGILILPFSASHFAM